MPVVPPHQVPGVRVGVEEAVDQDLLVVTTRAAGAPPPCARRPRGRCDDRDRPATSCITSRREVERSPCTSGTRGARSRRSPRASGRCWRPPAGSRARDAASPTGARTPRPCRSPAFRPGRSPTFSANSSSSARSCSISSRGVRAAGPSRRPSRRSRASRGAPRRSCRPRAACGSIVSNTSSHGHAQLLLHHLDDLLLGERRARGPAASRAPR